MSDSLTLAVDARGIATLTLNRPEKRNAFTAEMIGALHDAALSLGADPKVRAVILAGAGDTFCGGADLGWMRAQMAADRAARMAEARRLATMLRVLNGMPKPLVGRVQGDAFGGGVGLLSVCDVVIAAEGAKFGLTEVRLGIIPATISPYVSARIGETGMRRAALSGRLFDAGTALRLGLVTQVVAPGDLDRAVAEEAEAYLSAAPGAVARAKALYRSLGPVIDDALMERTILALADAWEAAEAAEGIGAFFDRRKPGWAEG